MAGVTARGLEKPLKKAEVNAKEKRGRERKKTIA